MHLSGKALVLKVDVDQQPALAAEFAVRAIPTFVVIRDREVVKHHPGLAMPGTIKRWLATRYEEPFRKRKVEACVSASLVVNAGSHRSPAVAGTSRACSGTCPWRSGVPATRRTARPRAPKARQVC